MAVYDSFLYVGTYDSSGGAGCQVWSFDGANWTRVGSGGFGDPSNLTAACMAAGGLDLYVGTYNEDGGCEVWRYDGEDWNREAYGGFGNAGNVAAPAMLLEGADLVAGTQCENGCQAWATQAFSPLYFAEGYTGVGFQEYLCLGNPQPQDARVAITYLFPDATALNRIVVVPAESRLTVFVNADVGADRDVSVALESDREIMAERPMYFIYNGAWRGGHNAMGTPSPCSTGRRAARRNSSPSTGKSSSCANWYIGEPAVDNMRTMVSWDDPVNTDLRMSRRLCSTARNVAMIFSPPATSPKAWISSSINRIGLPAVAARRTTRASRRSSAADGRGRRAGASPKSTEAPSAPTFLTVVLASRPTSLPGTVTSSRDSSSA